jgi:hypothetical protein
MPHPHHGTPAFARRQPELPAFCRTRRQRSVTVQPSRLRWLERLLWLVVALQLSTLLLLLSGPIPSQLYPSSAPHSNDAAHGCAQGQVLFVRPHC